MTIWSSRSLSGSKNDEVETITNTKFDKASIVSRTC